MNKSVKYDEDSYSWFFHTAQLLREKRMNEIDIDHLIQEMEDMGNSLQNALESDLATLIQHLLKWQFQPSRRAWDISGKSWTASIKESRRRVTRRLQKSPGLKGKLAETFEDAYAKGRYNAYLKTFIEELPLENPYTFEQIMNNDFYPK